MQGRHPVKTPARKAWNLHSLSALLQVAKLGAWSSDPMRRL